MRGLNCSQTAFGIVAIIPQATEQKNLLQMIVKVTRCYLLEPLSKHLNSELVSSTFTDPSIGTPHSIISTTSESSSLKFLSQLIQVSFRQRNEVVGKRHSSTHCYWSMESGDLASSGIFVVGF